MYNFAQQEKFKIGSVTLDFKRMLNNYVHVSESMHSHKKWENIYYTYVIVFQGKFRNVLL